MNKSEVTTSACDTRTTAQIFPIGRLIVDLFLTVAFWVFMSGVLRPHVPSEVPFWINLWSCLTAACISGVFFIALQMFRLVLHGKE